MRQLSRRNVRSLQDLASVLDEQLARRRREIHELLNDLSGMPAGPGQDAHVRACWVLLYAHWEGFAKVAVACYIDLLQRRKAPLRDLHVGLRAVALRNRFSDLSETSGLDRFLEAARWVVSSDAQLDVDPDKTVLTWERMDWAALRQVIAVVDGAGRCVSPAVETAVGQLHRVRNQIAHGVLVHPDPGDLAECLKHIDEAMTALGKDVEDSAQRHLAGQPSPNRTEQPRS